MRGFILTIYLKTFRKISRIPIVRRIWQKLYDAIKSALKNKPAKIRLHGFNATLPFNHPNLIIEKAREYRNKTKRSRKYTK
jgi:hypothetical protein